MTTNLNPIEFGSNKYCGPAVMSTLTGISTDEAEKLCIDVTGRKKIIGLTAEELRLALRSIEWDMGLVKDSAGGSLYFFFATNYMNSGLYIVTIPGHWIAVEIKDKKVYLCDNACKTPINAGNSARLGQKVVAVYKVSPVPMQWKPFFMKFIQQEVGL